MREDLYTNGMRKTSQTTMYTSAKTKPWKVTTVGDGLVGKTCMLISYTKHEFPLEYVPTVFDNFPMNMNVDGTEYSVTLWDTAGQEDYEKIRPLSYPHTDCFLLCYSVGSRSSYENIIQKWYPELKYHCPNVPIILIGTKCDLREKGEAVVTLSEGKKLKNKIHAAKYMECSALQNKGLEEIFLESMRCALRRYSSKKEACIFL